jgi:hypothetical protein
MDLTPQRMVNLLLTKLVKATGKSRKINGLRDFVFIGVTELVMDIRPEVITFYVYISAGPINIIKLDRYKALKKLKNFE